MSAEERARRDREQKLKAFRAATESVALRIAQMRFGGNGVRNGHDPQEAVDEAYAYFERKNYIESVPAEKQRAMICKIVTGKAIDMVKYEKPTGELPEGDHHEAVGAEEPGYARVEDDDETRSIMDRAESVLEALTDRQRDILERFYVGEQSTREIGEALDITDRAVRLSLQGVRERLGRKLKASPVEREQEPTEDEIKEEGGN